ncbi:MAG: phosphoserine phosphatase SerB [Pseudomonadota bacterium]
MSDPTHAIVLTANPARGLSDDQIKDAASQFAGNAPRRLSDSAAEIRTASEAIPSLDGVDTNRVSLTNRQRKLLIADMDSTMIPVECIDEVADFAGVRDQVVAITEPAMRGEISFEEALRARVALMKGLAADKLQQVYDERVALNPGARTLIQTMRAKGAHTALVSGGFTFFTERVATAAGFHENRANRLVIENGALTGTVEDPILGREAKVSALEEVTARLGISASDALAVGDGANDLGMIGAAGLGVAYHAKPVVAEAADCAINHGDLTALLYLQGFSEGEFSDA